MSSSASPSSPMIDVVLEVSVKSTSSFSNDPSSGLPTRRAKRQLSHRSTDKLSSPDGPSIPKRNVANRKSKHPNEKQDDQSILTASSVRCKRKRSDHDRNLRRVKRSLSMQSDDDNSEGSEWSQGIDNEKDCRGHRRCTRTPAKRPFQTDSSCVKNSAAKKRRLENERSTAARTSRRQEDLTSNDTDIDVDIEDSDEDLIEGENSEKPEDEENMCRIEKIFACRWRTVPAQSCMGDSSASLASKSDSSRHSQNHSPVTFTTFPGSHEMSTPILSSTNSVTVHNNLAIPESGTPSFTRDLSTVPVLSKTAPISSPSISNSTPIFNASSLPSPSSINSVATTSTSSATPDNTNCTTVHREMEYLIKFEGVSYRRLQWKTRSELVRQKNDTADLKVHHFHRKVTGRRIDKEVQVTAQDDGNFCLYRTIDRVIGVRQLESNNNAENRVSVVGESGSKKEYLMKWQLLGYAESTWESEANLTSPEDREAIERFIEINTSFEFPVCVPPAGIVMACNTSQCPQNRKFGGSGSSSKVEEPFFESANTNSLASNTSGVIRGEAYQSDAVTSKEGTTRLWQAFLRRKLAKDGTYIPSIRRRRCMDLRPVTTDIKLENKPLNSLKTVGSTEKPNLENVSQPPSPGEIISARFLMAHQQEGLKWLFFNSEVNRHGSLLADEMGLGKTCQSIAFLEHYLDIMSVGRSTGCHALVVVQKSVLENWRREFQIWAPHLNVLALCGGRRDREVIKEYEYKWICTKTGKQVNPPSTTTSKKLVKPDVVLVTYEGLRTREFQQLTGRNFKWTVVVVDECQKVKGGRTSLLLNLLAQLKRELMILLTGTPIQNTTEELFPMLTLLHPTRFYYDDSKETKTCNASSNPNAWSSKKFNNAFSQIQDREDCMQLTEELHQLMAPYILRREKARVLKTLPPKTVKLVKIPLTLIQKRVYSALYHKSIRTKGLKFSNIHMQLRKCCIHPYLIEGMEDLIHEGKIGDENEETEDCNSNGENENRTRTIDTLRKNESADEKAKRLILESSGKFVLLKKMLESFRESGRKVLIFSFFKTALDLIEDFIHLHDFAWVIERVDGETSGEERQLAIDRFNTDRNRFLFLCTTRAGGLGINLTAASVVIHLDSDFNPQHDLQAQARCHRIGQEKNVDVFHFIAEHTYEDYMLFTIAGKKLGLEAVLLGRLDVTKGKAKLDKQQEEKVLRKGVFAAIRDDDAAGREARDFANSSIEEILSAKSTTVVLEPDPTPTEDYEANAGTTVGIDEDLEMRNGVKLKPIKDAPRHALFSTAKFAVSHDEENKDTGLEGLDEDKPDFWVKVAQRLGPWVLEEEKPQELTRADRRRGRNVNYRSAFYDDDYYVHDGRRGTRIPKHLDSNGSAITQYESDDEAESSGRRTGSNAEEEDDVFTPLSGTDNDTESDEDDRLVKDDIEVGLEVVEKTRLPGMSAKHYRRPKVSPEEDRRSLKDQMNWNDWTDLEPIGGPCSSSESTSSSLSSSLSVPSNSVLRSPIASSLSSPPVNAKSLSFGLPTGPQGGFVVLDLLYRCLRALKRWRTTKVGETGGLRTDDIRDADRCSPWSLSSSAASCRPTTSGADQLLRQSWLETLQEWKQAGIDWDAKRSSVVDRYAKQVLATERDELEQLWIQHLKKFNILSTIKLKEQLIQRELQKMTRLAELSQEHEMNQFFISEARRQALTTHGEVIVRESQRFCDTLAADALTGRHFSREFTIKKQTWIGAEDFCIKLVFVHLMAQRYAQSNPQRPVTIMRWPPPQLEINWAIVTEVIKRLNRYTGGPERRRAAIHERFYNKLDSRWNHEDFTQQERDVLAIAVANGLAAHIVAEEMPGRSLERVKKGLRCPSVIREAQRVDLLIQQPYDVNGVPKTNTTVIDIIARFREICQEAGLSSKFCQNEDNGALASQTSYTATSTSSTGRSSAECSRTTGTTVPSSRMSCISLPPSKVPPSGRLDEGPLQLSPTELLIESIRAVLLRIGVHERDFEALRPSLLSQSIQSLAQLLKQLKEVQEREDLSNRSTSSATQFTLEPSSSIQNHMANPPIALGAAPPGVSRSAPVLSANSVVVLDDDDTDDSRTGTIEPSWSKQKGGSPESDLSIVLNAHQKQLILEQLHKKEAFLEIELKNISHSDTFLDEEGRDRQYASLFKEKLELQQKLALVSKVQPTSPRIALATPVDSTCSNSTPGVVHLENYQIQKTQPVTTGSPIDVEAIDIESPDDQKNMPLPTSSPLLSSSSLMMLNQQVHHSPPQLQPQSSSSRTVRSGILPSAVQQSLAVLLKVARPDQIAEIHRRMQSDPAFAARVVQQVNLLQQKVNGQLPTKTT